MYDERIKEEDGVRYLKLYRVTARTQIKSTRSAFSQELERQEVRNEMDERAAQQAAQETFGICPNCGENEDITLYNRTFQCKTCKAKLKRGLLYRKRWKMLRGHQDLVGEALPLLEWEQIAIEHLKDGVDINQNQTERWKQWLKKASGSSGKSAESRRST